MSKYQTVFLPGSKIIDDFGKDLAVYTDLKLNRTVLIVEHKEKNQVIRLEVWGKNTDVSVLESFAHAYLKAPTT
jgi:hypothetical protein